MKKNIKIIIIVLLLLITTQLVSFADEYYDINKYDISIQVNENNEYIVYETLYVNFKSPRHGIYRDIPFNFYGYAHEISDILVYNPINLNAYKYETSYSGSNLQIQIGDADTYVQGENIYQINYTFDGSYDFNDEYDEFYFNIIGNDWDTKIDEVNFTIEMPKEFNAENLNITSGYFGSTGSNKVQWKVNDKTITGSAKSLLPNEGVTIALYLKEGYYSNVSKPYSVIWLYLLIVFLIIALVGSFYIKSSNYRRNKLTPVLNFYPPNDLNPAEMAYIYNEEKLSNKEVSSIIIYWASKGYLRIIEKESNSIFLKDSITFEKLVDSSVIKKNYEKSLFNDLFSYGYDNKVTIKELENVFYENLDISRSFIRDIYRDDKEILENIYQYGIYVASFIVLLLTSAIFAIYFQVLFGIVYIIAFLTTFSLLFAFWAIALVIALRKKNRKKRSIVFRIIKYSFIFFVISQSLGFVKNVIDSIDFKEIQFNSLTILIIVSTILFIVTIFIIGKIKRYSPYGRKTLDNIYGFMNFLETAKLDRLEMLYEKDPTYFYDMLPYVMIFDLSKIWDKNIERLSLDGPDWYISNRHFTSYMMMSSMNKSFSQMTTKPQSSSSFGGGSVGGGAGGGGGGSW